MALNRVNDLADSSSVLVSAHDEAGRMVALLSFVPWGPTGLSLDVMRRSPEAPNGVVEFMVASLMEQAATLGVRRVSLNFAMFGHIFEAADQVGASAWNRFASRSLGVLDRFLQLRRLYCPAVGSSFFGDGADVGDGKCCVCRGHGGGFLAESVGAPFAGSGAASFCR